MGATSADIITLAMRQRGDRYVLGAEASPNDANPSVFDCSELVEWDCSRNGVKGMPDGAANQWRYCSRKGTAIPVARAVKTQGALLFRIGVNGNHVALSLGNGSTIEARGHAYGVNVFPATGRTWTGAALIPGVRYGVPVKAAPGVVTHPTARPKTGGGALVPAFPGRVMLPGMKGADVRRFMQQLAKRGWHGLDADDVYDLTEAPVVAAFQREKHLAVDRAIGLDTWQAAWRAPVT